MFDRQFGPFLAAAMLLLAGLTMSQEDGPQKARCRTLYPPYAITADEAQYVTDTSQDPVPWEIRMFGSKHSNGPDSLEFYQLTIHPGNSWPIHRHFEADEWIYVVSGSGGYAYWALENPELTQLTIGPGSVLYNPQGQLHQIWNTGEEPLVLVAVSKSLDPVEVLEDWPEVPEGGEGTIADVQPWELSCAPGHEVDPYDPDFDAAAEFEEGEEAAAEGEEGLDGSVLGGAEAEAKPEAAEGVVGEALEVTATRVVAASGGDGEEEEDDGEGCGCGAAAAATEDHSAQSEEECVAAATRDDEYEAYESTEEDDDDYEPEWQVINLADPEEVQAVGHDEL